ncbi:MAG: hypothetical protein GWN00_09820, partial [Aliifodinibius sp.]|nr:hypothetical protein [Phycisphaerae bacterium]NIR64671.1 hypothetical protein [candidate division Zixibacteria bacterium]NIT56506.1 hypothetical protein [Fodinibius sp.]NIW44535.1 hypothetical protein [Gammaproteobacteria bacterium]NIS45528.1 hypothetical protein [candidate division Zixibacteria bacterium]
NLALAVSEAVAIVDSPTAGTFAEDILEVILFTLFIMRNGAFRLYIEKERDFGVYVDMDGDIGLER